MQAILEVATSLKKLVIIAGSESEAADVSRRLTVRGVPVLLAVKPDDANGASVFESDSTTALVTTAEYAEKNGPLSSPMTIHLRPPFSVRSYVKRLKSSVSAVHVTFVTPEDESRAGTFRTALSANTDSFDDDVLELRDLLDLTASDGVASVDTGRRRFSFRSDTRGRPILS